MLDGIIGRGQELEAAAEFLTGLERGSAALVFAGEPGIGKTTVWQEAVERARASSFLVLSARPVEAEARLAFAALADLLEPVVDEALPGLPEPQRRALAVALLREEPGSRPVDQRAVSAATSAVLGALAQRGSLVVAIDDLQWLDRPSARVLEFAIRRLAEAPIGVLASERVDRGSRLPLALDRVVPEERFRRIELGPLSLAGLHELLKERSASPLTRRMLVRIERASGGNPFFALEIARSLPEDAPSSAAVLPVPERLLALVEDRILALPKRTRTALLAASALRSPTVELVGAVDGRTPAESRRALEQAEAVGIAEVGTSQLRFAHPIFAEAVYSAAAPTERRRIHRRLAPLVVEIEERARHLALGAEGADAELARVLDAAAEHARSRGAPESAAELAEQAWALTPPDDTLDIQRRSLHAAEYRFLAGELRPARELLEVVLSRAPPGRARAEALRLMGDIRYHEQSFPEAVSLFEEALEHVGDDERVEAAIQIRLTFSLNGLGDWAGAEPHARRALALTQQLGDGALMAEALAVLAILDFLLGRGLDEAKLRRALELEDPHRQVAGELRPSVIAAFLMLYVGELERSTQMFERERERMLERGEESGLPFLSSNLAWAECWRGNLAKAATYAEESIETATRLGSAALKCSSLCFAAVVDAHRGDAASARRYAGQSLALVAETGWNVAVLWANWALGMLALSLEDAKEAHAALGPLTTMVEQEGLPEPVRAMFLADEIEALIMLGELDRAARLVDMLEQAGRRLERAWALVQAGRCRALLLAARGDLDGAAQAAHEALATGENLELRLELGRTFLVAGQIERRRRRKRRARELLEQALEIFEAAGARLWAQRAQSELGRAAGRATGDVLTAAEERVARLAASGLTNRAVAAQLFMSPKTVEANLARAYRKLGIHSRAELGARLANTGREPAQT